MKLLSEYKIRDKSSVALEDKLRGRTTKMDHHARIGQSRQT